MIGEEKGKRTMTEEEKGKRTMTEEEKLRKSRARQGKGKKSMIGEEKSKESMTRTEKGKMTMTGEEKGLKFARSSESRLRSPKFIPGSDVDVSDIFMYPFFEGESKKFISDHKRIMFLIRGLPGTAKGSLAELLKDHFPTSVICSANDYFENSFEKRQRSAGNFKLKSHEFCHRAVLKECKAGSHPIVVKNSHVRLFEMETYFSYAEEYQYTVIVLSTLDKFSSNPKELAKSNRQGLTEEYFKYRLAGWRNVNPFVTGFFLNSDDSFFILNHFKNSLDSLLLDGKFCRIFDAYDKDAVLNYYKAKTLLFCVAAYAEQHPIELKQYFKYKALTSVGKCFTLTIKGFLVTETDAFAVVGTDASLRALKAEPHELQRYNCRGEERGSDLCATFEKISLRKYKLKTTELNQTFETGPITAVLDINDCETLSSQDSFVHLAEREEKDLEVRDLKLQFARSAGEISSDAIQNLQDNCQIFRLQNNAWFVRPREKILVKSVFTGLYR